MPRVLSPAMTAALSSTCIKPILFVSIAFASETVYISSASGTTTWNGHDWLGLGRLLNIGLLEDAAVVEAKGISIRLSGLDPALLTDCLGDFKLGQPVNLYVGIFDGAGAIIADPLLSWSGLTDQ